MSAQQWARIPAELRQRPQWLLAAPNDKGEFKVPTTVDGEGKTRPSNTNRSAWLPFPVACQEATTRGLRIGYCIAEDDPFACIDLDVKDKDNAPDKPESWTTPEQFDRFHRIVHDFDSYTELSQSGKGLHIWVAGKIGSGKNRDGVELYSETRFIVCTGNVHSDKPIADRQTLLARLHAQLGGSNRPRMVLDPEGDSDDTGLSLAAQALECGSDELKRLFAGDYQGRYKSQSEADMALIMMLAKISKSNKAVWDAFMESGLGQRDKAEDPGYRRRTLTACLPG